MLRFSLSLAIFLLFFSSLAAQWQFGLNGQATRAQMFKWQTGPIFDMSPSTGIEYWIEYRFEEKKRGPFTYQDGIRTDLQLISRNIESPTFNSQWLRLPFWWTRTMPRRIKDDKYPLFDFNTSIGYYLAKPIAVGGERQGYSTHGFISEAGLAFYIQTGSRININYRFAMDLGSLGGTPDDSVQRFVERGLTIGFSSSFPDTKVRLKAMKQYQKNVERKDGSVVRRNKIAKRSKVFSICTHWMSALIQ